jgi:hypothetical protein
MCPDMGQRDMKVQNPVHRSFRWNGHWACVKDNAPSGASTLALYL